LDYWKIKVVKYYNIGPCGKKFYNIAPLTKLSIKTPLVLETFIVGGDGMGMEMGDFRRNKTFINCFLNGHLHYYLFKVLSEANQCCE
jgi:hypothetical protein